MREKGIKTDKLDDAQWNALKQQYLKKKAAQYAEKQDADDFESRKNNYK